MVAVEVVLRRVHAVGAGLEAAFDPERGRVVRGRRDLVQVHDPVLGQRRLVRVQDDHDLRAQAADAVLRGDDRDLSGVQQHERPGREHADCLRELVHQLQLELDVRERTQLPEGAIGRLGARIGPRRDHGVVGVHDAGDAPVDGNCRRAQPRRVARAVVALVVVGDHLDHARIHVARVLQQLEPVLDVVAHQRALSVIELAGLVEDGLRQARLADIEQHGAERDRAQRVAVEPDLAAEHGGPDRRCQRVRIEIAALAADAHQA
jgi:hypothetical protein